MVPEQQVEQLVESGLEGHDFEALQVGQFIDTVKNVLANVTKLASDLGLTEDAVIEVCKKVYDVWAASNKLPAFADNIIWQVIERGIRQAI